jgi:hypothetical protein
MLPATARAGTVALIASLAWAASATAQSGNAGMTATASSVRIERSTASESELLTGVVLGAAGQLSRGRVQLGLAYREGSVSPDSGTGASRDLVEGQALVTVRPITWLAVSAGALARAMATGGGTARWVIWQAASRFDLPLSEPNAFAHFEMWQSLGGSSNTTQPLDGARGGEAGLRVFFGPRRFRAELSYSVERVELGGGALVEVMERLRFGFGIGGR